jgi:hypothetical protein
MVGEREEPNDPKGSKETEVPAAFLDFASELVCLNSLRKLFCVGLHSLAHRHSSALPGCAFVFI